MPGPHCAVPGCHNGTRGISKWKRLFCSLHQCYKGISRCICDPPYVLFPFPTERRDPKLRAEWIKLMNRKNTITGENWTAVGSSRVCSLHFVGGAPSADFPSPTLNLGVPSGTMAQSSMRCYCSVPFCSNNKQHFPYLSFHDFPANEQTRACWKRAIRRDEGPNFRILRGSTFVCSQHFAAEDLYSQKSGRVRIKTGSVPSRFAWNNWGKGPQDLEMSTHSWRGKDASPLVSSGRSQIQESVPKRLRKQLSTKQFISMDMSVLGNIKDGVSPACAVAQDHDYTCLPSPGTLDSSARKIKDLEQQVSSLQLELKLMMANKEQVLIYKYCITDEDFRFFTRFSSKEIFIAFWELVYPASSKLVYWSRVQQTVTARPSSERMLPLIDELFMFLCRIAAGIHEKTLAVIFNVSLSTVRRIIITWTSYLYEVLCSFPLWMRREQVQATMPDKFRLTCPEVRVIIDCAEIRCETPSALSRQSDRYSGYKNHTTFKGLLGIAPCGVITFVSKLYTGSISDQDITKKSQILRLLQPNDGVMADQGFLIKNMLSDVGATLITPPQRIFSELSMESLKTQAIAHTRILAEKAIQRVKEYHVWNAVIPLSMFGSVNQLWVICCVMSNYQGPVFGH